MRRIQLNTLSVENFQCFQNRTFEFSAGENRIEGENGSGKTTVYSALCWLLFGKDAYGQSAFEIKRKVCGKTVDKADVRVTGTFTVLSGSSSEDLKLEKVLHEKWVMSRKTERYSGDETLCFVNEVPVKVGEYQSIIAGFMPEEEFRMITSLYYFLSKTTDFKREYLCQMGGVRSVEDICGEKAEWQDFLDTLSGKTLQQALAQFAYEKKKLKEELDKVAPAVTALEKVKPEPLCWASLEARQKELTQEMAQLTVAQTDESARIEAVEAARRELSRRISTLKSAVSASEDEIASLKRKAVSAWKADNAAKDEKRIEQKRKVESLRRQLQSEELSVKTLSFKHRRLEKEMDELFAQYNKENQSVFVFNGEDTVCPLLQGYVCRSEEMRRKVEADMGKAEADFNERKQRRIQEILTEGKAKRAERDEAGRQLEESEARILSLKKEIEANETVLGAMKDYSSLDVPSDLPVSGIDTIRQDMEEKRKEIAGLSAQLESIVPENSDTGIEIKLGELAAEQKSLSDKLATRGQIERIDEEIRETQERGRKLAERLSGLEMKEMTANDISRAIVEDATERINSLFTFVKWRLFEPLKNGGYAECCKPEVDGVAYCSINTAKRINAGIDICNAISRFKGIEAPLFLDGMESVNGTIHTDTQTIKLAVAPQGTPLTVYNN